MLNDGYICDDHAIVLKFFVQSRTSYAFDTGKWARRRVERII